MDVENGDGAVSSGYGFLNIHTLFQCKDSSTFKDMDEYVEEGGVSSIYGYMNIQSDLQQNGLESLMNYNDSNDTDMNATLQNVDISIGIFYYIAILSPKIMNQVT